VHPDQKINSSIAGKMNSQIATSGKNPLKRSVSEKSIDNPTRALHEFACEQRHF
jgi:hypothetical protein